MSSSAAAVACPARVTEQPVVPGPELSCSNRSEPRAVRG